MPNKWLNLTRKKIRYYENGKDYPKGVIDLDKYDA